jgi:hypothetical protein
MCFCTYVVCAASPVQRHLLGVLTKQCNYRYYVLLQYGRPVVVGGGTINTENPRDDIDYTYYYLGNK